MTRLNSAFVLRRTSERLTAGAAAIGVTFLMLLTVEVRAAETVDNPPRISGERTRTPRSPPRRAPRTCIASSRCAARKVCGLAPGDALTLDQRHQGSGMCRAALADAVQRINRPMLTSVHESSARDLG